MKIIIFLIILLIIFSNVFSELSETSNDSLQTYEQNDLRIPMYERQDNALKDFRVNQTFRQAIRWANIGAITGVGLAIAIAPEDDYGLAPLAFGLLGTTVGIIGGPIYGIIYGYELEEHKKKNTDFHTKRYRIGNEFSNAISLTKVASMNPKYFINLQTFSSDKYFPTEYRVGVMRKEWTNEDEDYDMEGYTHRHFAEEIKIDFNVLFNSNKRFIIFFYGGGIGYSWGENRDTYHPDDIHDDWIHMNTQLEGIFIHPIAGISINFADFFFGRFEIDYELSTFFYKARDYNDYPYAGNAHISFSFGTYLF
ncbi:MAG: hypothetical protein HOD64_00600 [Candidatus Cloacimonetes bacterium]|jgi:hypothetical protein|nr:hypothetical protein [Candidatus Cloacimonadota bacterium]MBT4331752.1 hypothetical protein [Candidatus Cloacimonadota bacterium]MBT4574846.1 hypothetical protein [Candidatus Cloacimonadota bacterium]